MLRRQLRLCVSLAGGGLLLVALLALLGQMHVPAVSAEGCNVPGDYATIQEAVDDPECDAISVAAGTYDENVVITRAVILQGAGAASTIIDGGGSGVVISISDGVTPTIDGFTITGGDGTGNGGQGGGISILGASAIIRNNVITGNVAGQDSSGTGAGGGIFVVNSPSPVLIYSNTIQNNIAYSSTTASADYPGCGGGIRTDGDSSAVITGNQFIANVAGYVPETPVWAGGGAICAIGGRGVTIGDNTIRDNWANAASGVGEGGGIFVYGGVATITNNSIYRNTAAFTVTTADEGTYANAGGIGINQAPRAVVIDNWVTTNTVAFAAVSTADPENTSVSGGAINVFGDGTPDDYLLVQGNHLLDNVGTQQLAVSGTDSNGNAQGGGLAVNGVTTTLILDNEVMGNVSAVSMTASSLDGSGYAGAHGGGIHVQRVDALTLSSNQVAGNLSAGEMALHNANGDADGAVAVQDVISATIHDNTVERNTAVMTGAITSDSESYDNSLDPRAGGLMVSCASAEDGGSPCQVAVTGNQVTENTGIVLLSTTGPATGRSTGGGMFIRNMVSATLTGNWIMSNTAAVTLASTTVGPQSFEARGGGLFLSASGWPDADTVAQIENNTIQGNLAVASLTTSAFGSNSQGEVAGGGMLVEDVAAALLLHNQVRGNIAVEELVLGDGGGGNPWGGSARGGGIALNGVSQVTLHGNVVEENVAAQHHAVHELSSMSGGGGIDLSGAADITLHDNTVQHNTSTVEASIASDSGQSLNVSGGGILVNSSGVDDARLWLAENTISTNTAVVTLTTSGDAAGANVNGGGAGINQVATATILSNQVQDNLGAGSLTLAGANPSGAIGGGFAMDQVNDLTMRGNQILSNTAAGRLASTEVSAWGQGGGLAVMNAMRATMEDNTLSNNVGLERGDLFSDNGVNLDANGGGAYIDGSIAGDDWLQVADNHFLSNQGVISLTTSGSNARFNAVGGGLTVRSLATSLILTNEVRGNLAAVAAQVSGDDTMMGPAGQVAGGGIYMDWGDNATLRGNQVLENVAAGQLLADKVGANGAGGGIAVQMMTTVAVETNTVEGNIAVVSGTISSPGMRRLGANGGGISHGATPGATLSLVGNDIRDNTAAGWLAASGANAWANGGGGGISLNFSSAALVQSNLISGNVALREAGSASAGGSGGGIQASSGPPNVSQLTMERNLILGNLSDPTYINSGGGLAANQMAITSTNDLFARNLDGLMASGSNVRLVHDTFYANGHNGVLLNWGSQGTVTDTVVYSHNTGLTADTMGDPATHLVEDYDLLSNAANYAGSVSLGTHTLLGENPRFANPGGDDCHLGVGSPAIDAGVDAGVAVDYDDDPRPMIDGFDIGYDEAYPAVSITDTQLAEESGAAVFTVTLDAPATLQGTVHYATSDGTAQAGSDYLAASGTLTFAPGSMTNTISISVPDDILVEPAETFSVTLSSPTHLMLDRSRATGTILNADLPALSVSDSQLVEGDSGTAGMPFTVTLSTPGLAQVVVQYATSDGTAMAGSDYAATSGALLFLPGTVQQVITVPIVGDTQVEPDETFTLTLTDPVSATLLKPEGVGTILSDELSRLSVSDAVISEGNAIGSMAFSVTLNTPSPWQATVDYSTADGTALAGSDYLTASGTLTFAPGDLEQMITVTVLGDPMFEPDETFTVTLTNPISAALTRAQGAGTLVNDDKPRTFVPVVQRPG